MKINTGDSKPLPSDGGTFVAFMLVSTLGAAGCRSKLDVETKSGASVSSPAVPSELPKLETTVQTAEELPKKDDIKKGAKQDLEALKFPGQKYHFQLRDTVRLYLSKSFVEGAQSLNIFNVTGLSEADEGQAPLVIQDFPIPISFTGELHLEGLGFNLISSGDVVLVDIFAKDSNALRGLTTGKNRLKIVVNDDINPRFTYVEITINGFSAFEFSQLSFSGNKHRNEALNAPGLYLEGWMNGVGPTSVKDATGETSLSSGFFSMMYTF